MDIEHLIDSPSYKLPNGDNLEREIITLTKSNRPAYWEKGGSTTSTGRATIVTNRYYQKLVPLYVKRKGMLSNANHALMPLRKGFKVIHVWHHREDFEICIMEVIDIKGSVATFEVVAYLLSSYD